MCQTYERVEEELGEFGLTERGEASRNYCVCHGCDVELSGADDTWEKNCRHQHIICSICYNKWFVGFDTLNFNVTQDWRKQIEHIFCPVCDGVFMNDGKLNLGKIAQEIQKLENNNTSELQSQMNVNDGDIVGEIGTYSSEEARSISGQMVVKTVELSGSSSVNINVQNETQIDKQNGNSPNNTSDHDTSHSNFEMITTTDFLGTAN